MMTVTSDRDISSNRDSNERLVYETRTFGGKDTKILVSNNVLGQGVKESVT